MRVDFLAHGAGSSRIAGGWGELKGLNWLKLA
jgi:hypothetical protein